MAARAGADALGFNFAPASPRYLEPDMARAIVETVPPFVSTVGVFVDKHPDELRRIMDECGLDYAQLHGNEGPRVVEKLSDLCLLKATRVGGEEDVDQLGKYRVAAHLLDARVPGQAGGTGETFDWNLARRAVGHGETVILAGGLTPDNVEEAVRKARPYAVDVASGVESEPGKKSREKVEAFIKRAKGVDL
jgi:phosphoribosylanthranilate isomerase